MKPTPIFSTALLDRYLKDFRLSSFPGARTISLKLQSLLDELGSGKTATLKEEEIKSRFRRHFRLLLWQSW